MAITNNQSGTNVHEVANGIFRISTPVVIEGAGGFSFNQYLVTDDEPLLFHTGPRKMFPPPTTTPTCTPRSWTSFNCSQMDCKIVGSMGSPVSSFLRASPLSLTTIRW